MKILLLTILAFISLQLKAQTWVQVPDANFQSYLTAHYPAGAFMTSGGNFFVDSDHAAIQAENTIDVHSSSIASIEGVQAFVNLHSLTCYQNQLTVLPSLPSTLTLLDCSKNQLTALPALPSTLVSLYCFMNQITVLPTLPTPLHSFNCSQNALTSIPLLPPSLFDFSCSYNQITSLPSLPNSLHTLICEHNVLTSLPTLPTSMIQLFAASNQLSTLPALPNTLTVLDCSTNLLTALPALPNSLSSLKCGTNQLTALPVLSTSLSILWCGNNQLNTLPILPLGLQELSCYQNELITLPDLPNSLSILDCVTNQLIALPELPASLTKLICSYNEINCFGEFPISLTLIALDSNPFTCLPNYVPCMNATLLAFPLCIENDPVNNPNNCAGATGLQGYVFDDNANNCVSTGADLMYVPMFVYDSNSNLLVSGTSLVNGTYYFSAGPGSYELAVDSANLTNGLEVTCPVNNSLTATTTLANPLVSAGDFGLNCTGYDLGIESVVPLGWYFPGETHELFVLAGDLSAQYNMHCASGISGEVMITVLGPGIATFGGSPTSVSGNTAVYSVADFGAVNANQFTATVLTNITATVGDNFCVKVIVSTVAPGELDTTNNMYTYCYGVVNSHDPNNKETSPEVVEPGFTDEFTYTIHFQNTGNAPAMNIRLADTLDSNLDLSTFKVVNASDAFTTTLNPVTRLLTVRFPNIMLPDSASNPEGSIGFIQYRVKPVAGLPDGTVIENTAYIYFDFNAPIITNTSENLFSETAGFTELAEETIQLYPNPSDKQVFIRSENNIEQVLLYDLNGMLVKTVSPNVKNTSIEVSDLKSGIYIATIQTNQSVITKRLIVR